MTTWRPIPNFSGYEASSDGRIRSHKRPGRPLVLKPGSRNGYPVVTIKDDSRIKRTPCVHRLVLLAFVGQPQPGQRVCRHLDGNPTNNRIENLRWGTHAENAADAIKHGTLNRYWGGRTECSKGHAYTPENTYVTGEGHRECRICKHARVRASREARRRQEASA
jgi:hypothetical protein